MGKVNFKRNFGFHLPAQNVPYLKLQLLVSIIYVDRLFKNTHECLLNPFLVIIINREISSARDISSKLYLCSLSQGPSDVIT